MNRSSVIALAAAALLGGAIARAFGQGEPPRPSQYEYKVFAMSLPDYREKDDYKQFLEKDGGNELRADADFRSYVLNYLAGEGWDLVQVVMPKSDLTILYLKRVRIPGVAPSEIDGSGGNLPGPERQRRPTPPK